MPLARHQPGLSRLPPGGHNDVGPLALRGAWPSFDVSGGATSGRVDESLAPPSSPRHAREDCLRQGGAYRPWWHDFSVGSAGLSR